jgi:2-amino-4-hydroxy-6-hydroxymethyldihydropteridine diphosphokinase
LAKKKDLEQAFIALGGNVGDVRASFRVALSALAAPTTRIVRVSSAYRTRALVAPDSQPQPDYWNAVAEVETKLSPRALLERLLALEQSAGRIRRERWGPRRLDLDLLTVGDKTLAEPGLTLPHPDLGERAFVLVPLVELAPHLMIPGRGTAAALLATLARQPGDVLERDEGFRR